MAERPGSIDLSYLEAAPLNRSAPHGDLLGAAGAPPEPFDLDWAGFRPGEIGASELSRAYVLDFFGPERGQILLRDAGLGGRDGTAPANISKVAFWRLCLDSIQRFNDEGHGCTPHTLPKSSWNMIFAAANHMATVEEGIRRFCELVPVLPSGMTAVVGHGAQGLHLTLTMADASTRGERFVEIIALVFHCVLVWGTDRMIEPVQVRLSGALDDRDGSLLDGLSADQVRHGIGVTITYPHACLQLPLGIRRYQRWAACETAAFLKIAVRSRPLRDIAACPVLRELRELLGAEPISQQAAAKRLGLSVPTLHRRLARAGTSFREISRDVRIGKLRWMLATDGNLDDIAAELGFSDRRSLWRACFEWLGMSPSAYRRQWRDAQPVPAH